MTRHPRFVLLLVLLLILAVLGVRALDGQGLARAPVSSVQIRAAAQRATTLRIVVSVAARRLWVLDARGDTLVAAPVAVGSGKTLRAGRRVWKFNTPRGVHSVLSKETDPVWVRPEWAYIEVARDNQLRLDSVSEHRPRPLSDGEELVVRGRVVGVLTDSAVFEPWPLDDELVFDDVLYVPPLGTDNREMRGTLGKYRLNLGDGVGIHGTGDHASIGRAVTHGCLRLGDADLARVFMLVPVGAPVFIY